MFSVNEFSELIGLDQRQERVVTVVQKLHGGQVRVVGFKFAKTIDGNHAVGQKLLLAGDSVVKEVLANGSVHLR